MTVARPAHRDRFGLALAVPPVAWAAQGLFGWFVAGHVCRGAGAAAPCFGPGAARLLVAAATLLALGATVATLVAARGRYRADGAAAVADERRRFVAFAALVTATALGVGLLWAGLPVLLLPFCGGASP